MVVMGAMLVADAVGESVWQMLLLMQSDAPTGPSSTGHGMIMSNRFSSQLFVLFSS